ncbi:pyridoxine 5'-phosphate synthase [Candidatus Kryptobacter tengchongensis]|uniref:Pyridoxine 5'-phosphate synthase n=2 Tax=Kryptobacter tengchongensis TaxID=1643429 RepID=A0A656D316_KRYT1|nr:pyridoxine 5'-phosphate synthase [Candidatus Kryptobacter tengchongensis]CUS96755.1 pyridoxine 5'-phosphate synthase [Candidatus Kryptobacter tengchongensis]
MRLSVNVDHVATLREARGGLEPDPVTAAHIAELAGADGIVCHLREDRRHIKDRDLRLLRETIKTKLDLEMAATEEMVKIAIETLPDLVTLVPERRLERTTERGLNVIDQIPHLTDVVIEMHKYNVKVSLFIDPDPKQIEASAKTGADFIEIHTGEYANARNEKEQFEELKKIKEAAKLARSLGLGVNAGHGLNYLNVIPITRVEEIEELSIGHAIVARAIFVGFERAVREMVRLVKGI